MGQIIAFLSKLFAKHKNLETLKILILGLKNSGKTTIFNSLGTKDEISCPQFNLKTVTYNKKEIHVYDVQDTDKASLYTGTQGILYVIDSTDEWNVSTAIKNLECIIAANPKIPIVVMLSKTDNNIKISVSAVDEKIVTKNRITHILTCTNQDKETAMNGFAMLVDATERSAKH